MLIIVLGSSPRCSVAIDDLIDICFNDEHLERAEFPIEVTEVGIVICVKDEHLEKAFSPIEVTEEGISNVICANNEHA